jgi:hypothetical protein
LSPFEPGTKVRIRSREEGRWSDPVPGISAEVPLTAFYEGAKRGFGTRHHLFRSRTGWRLALDDWEIKRGYDIRAE